MTDSFDLDWRIICCITARSQSDRVVTLFFFRDRITLTTTAAARQCAASSRSVEDTFVL